MLLPETLAIHDKNKFEFHYIYFLPWKDQMVELLRANGGVVTCMKARNNIELMFKAPAIASYCRKNNIDFIHAHLPWAGIVSRIVGFLYKVPVIYTEHNKQERYHKLTRIVNLLTLNLQERIIAVSDDVKGSIQKNKRTLKVPVDTILNGVNTNRFRPGEFPKNTLRGKFNIPNSASVIGAVAVFRPQKQLDVWLDLAKNILERNPGTHFLLVGDGPLKSLLKGRVQTLQLENYVHFAGLQQDIRPFLAEFDIFMMTSKFEGLPIALLEAMASGCPIITTNAGGIREVIHHEKEGLMCDVTDVAQLENFATTLLKNADKRLSLGLAGRRRIIEKFSLVTMVHQLESLYSEIRTSKRLTGHS